MSSLQINLVKMVMIAEATGKEVSVLEEIQELVELRSLLYPQIFIEISKVTYRKLEIGKVVTQPAKIIHTLDPFKPKI